ncbi:MAG: nicotinate-nucleotide--dimethylbenzimidazole phosphoribosyltransferase [Marinobacter sp.]|uniref:nicotinate-nucleotide--dimethylbenzimidazole phosphoribosyltransferase n=1 Tax=Marinobacter sp. TaxID=50741 RepID=UPI001B4A5435|nr:nicotinate-nucleotide--dimethylbenzimidazole phosphoribosyltransferase [Marinobacter sp.]MBQ0746013.1 nicotinate-nucleotide--dimethylbenzimidazole phosphoribosyltransferase [Marinobacter sp.]MBQ0814506.1 nicotinate-nucleotide--dimethylbenzimidazole phosphoribosyltransferase [Marinobacter sp.]|tara:strand:+ start:3868 stop:4947 length:1080 start_codon:yes stop_codon:yes gene_type:complete
MSFPNSWTTPPRQPEARFFEQAARRQSVLTKPTGSLGKLENVAVQLAGLQGTDTPTLDRIQISVFVGDHGICEEGISAYPQAVTAQMIANFASGGAAVSVLAKSLGAELEVVNLGTVSDVEPDLPGVIDARIAPCTRNFVAIDAMTTEQVCAALNHGDAAAQRASDKGCQLFIGGEMGIGNTTSATAVACALMEKNPMKLTGPGTGLDIAGVRHKAEVIILAIQRHDNDDDGQDAMAVLKAFGGFEIAALAGAIAGCAARSIPVLIDGYIVSVAALIAVRQQPDIRPWLLFAHRSAEPGHQAILAALNAEPLLDLGMRLGEGSGAAVAVPLLRIACELHNGMASFTDAGVSNKEGSHDG